MQHCKCPCDNAKRCTACCSQRQKVQDGIPTLRPPTRCFADLPAWIDSNLDQLEGKRVLMYCTGGVRCERASAYLRERGEAFTNVAQLKGMIQAMGSCRTYTSGVW